MKDYFIIIFLISIGFSILILSYYLFYKSKKTLCWISVKAKLDFIDIDKLEFMTDIQKAYRTKIRYSYKFDNKIYKSDRLFYGDFIRRQSLIKTKKLVNKYKREIVVYVNPLNPQDSVVEKGIPAVVNHLFIVGILFVIIGFILIIVDFL